MVSHIVLWNVYAVLYTDIDATADSFGGNRNEMDENRFRHCALKLFLGLYIDSGNEHRVEVSSNRFPRAFTTLLIQYYSVEFLDFIKKVTDPKTSQEHLSTV